MHKPRARLSAMVLSVAALFLLTSCATGYTSDAHASRVELYSSVSELADASALVVVGTVVDQRYAADIDEQTDFTISTLQVGDVVKGEVPSDTIEVRQLGSDKQPAPAPLLTIDGQYLLYLTPSGLEGDLADQFYVTGGNAGLYAASTASRSGDGNSFEQVQAEPGENLPAEIRSEDVLG